MFSVFVFSEQKLALSEHNYAKQISTPVSLTCLKLVSSFLVDLLENVFCISFIIYLFSTEHLKNTH